MMLQESEFRDRLQAGGAQTEAGRSSRVHAVRTIERKLAELGSPFQTLDEAWESDRFESLRQRIRDIRQDAQDGGEEFRILMPESQKPLNRLSNWNSWLAQYGRFLAGETHGEPKDADRIRQYVLEHYIEPARDDGLGTVDVLVSDVNRALELNQAWPNICQALGGKMFLELAEVPRPERIGADQSSATVFRFSLAENVEVGSGERPFVLFDAEGTAFRPVRNFSRSTGQSAFQIKPTGASNRAEEATKVESIVDVARAMLVKGLPARVKSFSGGPVNYLGYGKQELVRYELDAAIAREIGVPPKGTVLDANSDEQSALQKLRGRFLDQFPDFETVGAFTASAGRYHDTYRAKVDALLTTTASHAADGWAVLQDVLAASQGGRGAMPLFFDGDVNWRVPRARNVDPEAFDAALNDLVRNASDPAEAIVVFNDTFKPALETIGEPNAFRDTRVVPSTVLAAVAPNQAISVRYILYSNAERLLNDRTLFSNKPITAAEYRAVLALAEQIRSALIDWGWRPRDLWDVHGFIIATCADRNLDQIASPLTNAAVEISEMPDPTNLILYGPPGTGKTYRTAREAVRLCGDFTSYSNDDAGRSALMTRYRELVEARQIEFVTFHQNFSYEEFVEGLRPETGGPEDGEGDSAGFRLEPRTGIFREIAVLAELAQRAAQSGGGYDLAGRKIFKMSLGRAGIEDHIFQEAVDGGYAVLGWGGDIDWSEFTTYDAIHERWNQDHPGTNGNDANIVQTARFRVDMSEGDLIIVSYGNHKIRAIGEVTGPYCFEPSTVRDYRHRRDVKWLKVFDEPIPVDVVYNVPFIQWSCYLLKEKHLNRAALANLLPGDRATGGPPKQFVLIIDEINRANISKVFGELITLIEPDKRLGMANALKVRLPYSKREFGVPANLHIVGTMNTADRSIALLDTALRRRFRFEELAPDASLLPERIGDVPLRAMLETINGRIEYLLDRDHAIGHAFFIGKGGENLAAINDTMRFKVIPLLQEYFFEDWSRIHAVLGDGFIEGTVLEAPPGIEARAERKSWRIRGDFTVGAYERLIDQTRDRSEATWGGPIEDAAA